MAVVTPISGDYTSDVLQRAQLARERASQLRFDRTARDRQLVEQADATRIDNERLEAQRLDDLRLERQETERLENQRFEAQQLEEREAERFAEERTQVRESVSDALAERTRSDGLGAYRSESERIRAASYDTTARAELERPLADQLQAALNTTANRNLDRIDRVDVSTAARALSVAPSRLE